MITVCANLSWLVPGGVGGSEEYATRLLRGVIDAAPTDIDLRLVGPESLSLAHPELSPAPIETIRGPMNVRPYRIVMESTRGYRATAGADLVHHFGGRLPARRHGSDVLTIHDLQPLDRPENFSKLKRAYLRGALPRSAAAARVICTPSAWVAESVVKQLGVSAEKVRVVSSSWDGRALAADAIDSALLDSLDGSTMLLYPAVSHPHKNHSLLIDVASRLAEQHRDLTLVLTGGAGRADPALSAAIADAATRVVRPGRVGEATLRALLERADALVFPSTYEGFGLPVVEAMRLGTPVIAARATALPEVMGDAGLLVDPLDVSGWVDAVNSVLGDSSVRDGLIEKGRIRSEYFSPSAAAGRLLTVWREAI